MSSAKKKFEEICDKCAKKRDCDYKPSSNTMVLIRCLDFIAPESEEKKK